MATILPIAHNTGSTISGTEQIGDLAIGTTSQDYSSNIGGVKWWASPDLDLQYVIGYVDLSGTHPNPISFTPCYIGFWGCGNKTENSFIDLCNFQFNQNFTSGNDAKVWLNGNGYWTNFGMGITPLPTATPTLTPAPTSTPTALPATSTPTPVPATSTPAPTDTPTPTPTETPIGATSTPTPLPTDTPTPIPTSTSTSLPTDTPTPSPTDTPTPTPVPVSGNSLLMENGDNLLQENGDNLLLDILGYTFELVALPYNFPISGASIMNGAGGSTSGSTEINLLNQPSSGFYFNSIDFDGMDRTDYYSGFTGHNVTITMTQNGSTAIYSGDTGSFKYWIANVPSSETGFVFGTGIGVPPSGTPSGTATLIQAAPTPWVIGDNVTVSLEIT